MKKSFTPVSTGNTLMSVAVVAVATIMLQATTPEHGSTGNGKPIVEASVVAAEMAPAGPSVDVWPNPFTTTVRFTIPNYTSPTVTLVFYKSTNEVALTKTVNYSTGTMQVNTTALAGNKDYVLHFKKPNGTVFFKKEMKKKA